MGRKGLYIEPRIQQLSEGVNVLEARAEQLAALPPPPAPRKLEEGPASPPTKKSLSPDILWAGVSCAMRDHHPALCCNTQLAHAYDQC
jgi:hypothetical protein